MADQISLRTVTNTGGCENRNEKRQAEISEL